MILSCLGYCKSLINFSSSFNPGPCPCRQSLLKIKPLTRKKKSFSGLALHLEWNPALLLWPGGLCMIRLLLTSVVSTQVGVLPFNSDTNQPSECQIPQIKASVLVVLTWQPLLQMPAKGGAPCHLYLLLTGYKFRGSHDSFRFSNLLEQLTELKKVIIIITVLLERIQIRTNTQDRV